MIRFTGHTESRWSVGRPGPKNMENEVWPGLLLSSAGVQLYHTQHFTLGVSDDPYSDSSVTSDDASSIAESVELRNSGKPKKRVKFMPDELLVQIQEIPARGEEPEFDYSDPVALSSQVVPVPTPVPTPVPAQLPDEQPAKGKTDLSISGHSAAVLANHSRPTAIEKTEKLERPTTNRNNRDMRGTFTVTHAISPVSHNSSPKQSNVSSGNTSVQKQTSVPISKVPSNQQVCQQTPKSPSPVTRKPIFRGKSMGRIRKRVSKGTKEPKVKVDNAANLEKECEKKPDDSQVNSAIEGEVSNETQGEGTPKKSGRPRTGKKSTNNTKNKENNRGDGNRRINKTNPSNSSVSLRNGPRNLFRRFNPADYTGVRSSFSAISSERTKVRIHLSKPPLSADSVKLNTVSKVRVPAFGRVKSAPSKIISKLEKIVKVEEDSESNSTTSSSVNDAISVTKSNNFIFPEENSFRFPMMAPQKETTSQLVRLDSNMLSLYKKKLYAWHMANGTMPETRIETPCIAPMWNP